MIEPLKFTTSLALRREPSHFTNTNHPAAARLGSSLLDKRNSCSEEQGMAARRSIAAFAPAN